MCTYINRHLKSCDNNIAVQSKYYIGSLPPGINHSYRAAQNSCIVHGAPTSPRKRLTLFATPSFTPLGDSHGFCEKIKIHVPILCIDV